MINEMKKMGGEWGRKWRGVATGGGSGSVWAKVQI